MTVQGQRRFYTFKCSKLVGTLVLYGVPLLLLLNLRVTTHSLFEPSGFRAARYLSANPPSLDDAHELELYRRNTKILGPGDLPGYTGWARPSFTLAGWFQIDEAPLRATVGMTWTATVACHHALCQSGGALFDVRAYGPAIVPGIVTDNHDSTYQLTMHFLDPGSYTVEWVLAFSKTAPLDTFPRDEEFQYEGYLLPGFPLSVQVSAPTASWYSATALASTRAISTTVEATIDYATSSRRLSLPNEQPNDTSDIADTVQTKPSEKPTCIPSDILISTFTSSMHQGRWVVQERITDPMKTASIRSVSRLLDQEIKAGDGISSEDDMFDVSLEGYQAGYNSIGFRMAFERLSCYLPTMEEIRPRLDSRKRHLIMIGDSNMGRQERLLYRMYYNSTLTSIFHLNYGLQHKLTVVQQELDKLLARNDTDTTDYYILFNAGLHEIAQMCVMSAARIFSRRIKIPVAELGPCSERYKHYLTELIQTVQAFPAKLVVFQTTVAGWSKWGNYGFGWPATSGQYLPRANQFVEFFNGIAWNLMEEYNIRTMDGYWRSVARPDHREVTSANEIGAHLVHLGPEHYDLYMREWTLMVVQSDEEEGRSQQHSISPIKKQEIDDVIEQRTSSIEDDKS